ncbi:MobF family relaxase [Novosphingobium resinovorum]|uniref:MobF family relaxase n=1 Tax=Novosphingobium TaxID=165696 RepID=UPI001B3C52C3|nr:MULTISPECIES: MobF family relaxase [Novosphingobium]MBF7013896.1 conjugative relaxase [Novosphingobium sp. HR1a]WJM26040.1 MobF family relaxase [Novosphingobium resinovorum]
MHSIASVRSSSGAANYFTKDDFVSGEYYTDDAATEVSQWGGEGLRDSSLGGTVTKEAFEKVLNGETPTGEQVDSRDGRRPGIDLTFSAPKSVSIMAYIAGDKRILGPDGAHTMAVQKTMAWVEKNLAEGRKTVDGKTAPVATGNLVYALFQHDTSRALDPQAHIHTIVANMTRMPDGKWQALHADKIWANNTVIGSIYHSFLRNEMDKLGYKTELQGKHGTFEITGVPKTVLEAFSQRREEIMLKAEQLGIVSPKGRDGVTVTTRDPKLTVEDRDGLLKTWQDKAAALGFNGRDLAAAALQVSTAREADGPLDRSYQAIVDAVAGARDVLSGLMRSSDPLVDRGILRLVRSPAEGRAQLAVASAVRIHGQREAAFEIHRVAKTALDLGLKGVTIDHVSARIDKLIDQGKLLPGEIRVNGRMADAVTTPEVVATEERIIAHFENGKGQVSPIVTAADAPARLQAASPHELNAGQLAAATMIVSGSDRHVLVQGVAGAGKSTMLQAAATVLRDEGKNVLGLAFQNKMVVDMKEGMAPKNLSVEDMKAAGIEAQTIASFIWQNQGHLENPHTPAAQARRDEMKNTVIVVDETSMVSSDDMLKLVAIAEALGVVKTGDIGDRQQLSSIDQGKAFAMAQAAGAPMARMDQNIRINPDNKQLLTVAALANVGKAGQALRVLGDNVQEHGEPARQAAEIWLALSPAERATTAVFASGRESRGVINEEIQAGLLREGSIKGDGLDVTIQESVSTVREEFRYAHTYKVGQTLNATGHVPEAGIQRGQYEVTRVFGNGKVEIRGETGRKLRFDPQKIDPVNKQNRLEISTLKTVAIHEGDKIRWTATDKDRGLMNSAIAQVVSIEGSSVTFESASKEQITLERGDPMLSRLDLAYSLNMHMAQGITADKAIGVMLSYEKNLSNQRLFNVLVTRVKDGITMVVDDQAKLAQQLDRSPGDKTSALESLGRLDIDGPGAKTQAADAALSAAMAAQEPGDRDPIIIGDLDSLELSDLPPMGKSDTDYSKPENGGDPTREDRIQDQDSDHGGQKNAIDPLEGDGLGIRPPDVDDLHGLPPMPGGPEQLPGLPQKNLSLDL